MRIFAHIDNGVVTRLYWAEGAEGNDVPVHGPCLEGWTYNEIEFTKPASEYTAELNAKALELSRTKDAFAACLEIIFDFVKNPTLYSTTGQLKQATIAAYRAKL